MLYDYVLENVTAPGTGTTVSLAGAVSGRKSYSQVTTNGSAIFYFLDDGAQAEWGYGVFTTGTPNTVSRATVIGNTSGTTSRLNFTGTTRIYNSLPASRAVWLDANLAKTSGMIVNAADAGGLNFRAVGGSFGAGIRNDGDTCYLLSTDSGSAYSVYNAYRPLAWNLTTGAVYIDTTGANTNVGGHVLLNNARALYGKDTGAVNRPLLMCDSTNNTTMWLSNAGAYWRVVNFAATASLLTVDNSGNTATAGNLSVNGTATVGGDVIADSTIVLANNNRAIYCKDTGGTSRPLLTCDTANNTTMWVANAGAYWRIVNVTTTANLLTVDNSGNAVITGNLTAANLSTPGSVILSNARALYGADTGAVNRPLLMCDSTNNTTMWLSNAGTYWRVINFAGTASLLTVDNSGNTATAGSLTVSTNTICGGSFTGYSSVTAYGNIQAGYTSGGYVCKTGSAGSFSADVFNFHWSSPYINGYINSTYIGSIQMVSDERYKHAITPLTNGALSRILSLRPVHFRWQNRGIFRDDRRQHDGLLAQEVRRHIPDAVTAGGEGDGETMTLQPLALIAHLVAAVQELSAEVQALKAKLHDR